jgi:hypothetical protein
MLAAALEAEVDASISNLIDEVDEHGHRLVVRNGHAQPRSLVTGAGPIEVQAPRVDDCRVDTTRAGRRYASAHRSCPLGPHSPPRWPRCCR